MKRTLIAAVVVVLLALARTATADPGDRGCSPETMAEFLEASRDFARVSKPSAILLGAASMDTNELRPRAHAALPYEARWRRLVYECTQPPGQRSDGQ